MMTDNAGVLYLEGLTAGTHAIECEGHGDVQDIQVPKIGEPMATPVDLPMK
jgi:hypothetical protein